MATIVHTVAITPNIKIPAPVKRKNNNTATHNITTVDTNTPQTVPVIAIVTPNTGKIKCQTSTNTNRTQSANNSGLRIPFFSREGEGGKCVG